MSPLGLITIFIGIALAAFIVFMILFENEIITKDVWSAVGASIIGITGLVVMILGKFRFAKLVGFLILCAGVGFYFASLHIEESRFRFVKYFVVFAGFVAALLPGINMLFFNFPTGDDNFDEDEPELRSFRVNSDKDELLAPPESPAQYGALFMNFKNFLRSVESTPGSGGKTESERLMICPMTSTKYQVKTSAKFDRLKGFGMSYQSDMVGEFIATHVAHALVPYGPEGFITVDGPNIKAVSKYMSEGDILDNLKSRVSGSSITLGDKHVIFEFPNKGSSSVSDLVVEEEDEGDESAAQGFDETKDEGSAAPPGIVTIQPKNVILDHKSIAKALWLSMILGDHDCHTGNMWVFTGTQEGAPRIGTVARFDFGHAFNDFIGGDYEFPQNHNIDFLNRKTLKFGYGQTKLRRDFRNVALSNEFIEVLQYAVDNKDELKEKVTLAVKEALDTIDSIKSQMGEYSAEMNGALGVIRRNIGRKDIDQFIRDNIDGCESILQIARRQRDIKNAKEVSGDERQLWLYDDMIFPDEKVPMLTPKELFDRYKSASELTITFRTPQNIKKLARTETTSPSAPLPVPRNIFGTSEAAQGDETESGPEDG
jgi:hypothetical protein